MCLVVIRGSQPNRVRERRELGDALNGKGVIMTIAPYALMVVLAGAFAVVFLTRRNRAE